MWGILILWFCQFWSKVKPKLLIVHSLSDVGQPAVSYAFAGLFQNLHQLQLLFFTCWTLRWDLRIVKEAFVRRQSESSQRQYQRGLNGENTEPSTIPLPSAELHTNRLLCSFNTTIKKHVSHLTYLAACTSDGAPPVFALSLLCHLNQWFPRELLFLHG